MFKKKLMLLTAMFVTIITSCSLSEKTVDTLSNSEKDSIIYRSSDFSESYSVTDSRVHFTFISNVNSVWVDVHYKKNGETQMNNRMSQTTDSNWEQVTTEFTVDNGDVISYSYTYEKDGLAYSSGDLTLTVGSDSGDTGDSSDTGDTTALNTVTITPSGDSDVTFSITVESQKTQVHLFARKNGVQDYVIIDLQTSGEIVNADGTYTYYSTRVDSYTDGDTVEARFYTYNPSDGQVFYPGPGEEFTSIVYGSDTDTPDTTDEGITISGRQILVDGVPFYIKGVCWNPVPKGSEHPAGLDYAGYVDQDAALMQAAGINTVRSYEAITDTTVLDKLYERGIYVINTVYSWGGNDPSVVTSLVEAVKDHPAILMWAIGNEWNYNGIYYGYDFDTSVSYLNQAAAYIKAADTAHPITTIYGHIPSSSTISSMPDVDVWGLNIYAGIDFGTVFDDWEGLSDKPMYMAEYGADAWNANIGSEDTDSQATATRVLTQLLVDNSSVANASNVCSGGTIFEWADEWWKDSTGEGPWVHDSGGIAPGGGPYPDYTFNEEYWGIVDIDRNPRQAYYELQTIFNSF